MFRVQWPGGRAWRAPSGPVAAPLDTDFAIALPASELPPELSTRLVIGWRGADRAVRDLPGRRAVPGGRPGHRRAAGAARATRSSSPPTQTCCGQMHVNTGYQREALPLVRHHVETFEPLRRDRRAVRVVRRLGAPPARDGRPPAPATSGSPSAPTRSPARTYELSELLVDVLGVEDVGAYYPHRVTYHPTCHSLRMLRVGDKPLRLLRDVRGIDLVELPEADQCCGFGGTFALKNADTSTAMLADKMRHVLSTGAEVVHGRRLVLPDAHRRRPVPAAQPASAPCTWPRSSRDDGTLMTETFLGHAGARAARRRRTCAASEPFPDAARGALADTQLRRNLGHATRTIRGQARGRRRRGARLGGAARSPARRSRPPRWPGSTSTWSGWSARSPRAAASCTGRATPNEANRDRHRAGAGDRRRRGRQGQVDGHPGDRAQRGARGGRHRRRTRPTSPS